MKGLTRSRGPMRSLSSHVATLLSCATCALLSSACGAPRAASAPVEPLRAASAPVEPLRTAAAPSQAKAAASAVTQAAPTEWDFTVTQKWHLCEVNDLDDCTLQCNGGHLPSCVRLGNMYASGRGAKQDLAAAAELYELPCAYHIGVACSNRGSIFAHAHDYARAADYYGRGCDSDDAAGCYGLGLLYEDGSGVPADAARAASLYERACDGGELRGCENLGRLYALGNGVKRDGSRAVVLFQRACDGGDLRGCGHLGSAYGTGMGVPRDGARATELYKRACDGGERDFCAFLVAR